MSIKERDIKLLWGRSASRCAFRECRIKLTQDKTVASAAFPLGEQAHIIAEEPLGPRGQSPLLLVERNSYFNLILLCPTHHSVIDKNPEDYPVERLYIIKAEHELWVEQTLSETLDVRKQAQSLIYSSLVDSAVEACQLEKWQIWTSWALAQPPVWDADAPSRVYQFRDKVMSAVWPNTLPELERALQTLSIVMLHAVELFQRHAQREGSQLKGIRFYKADDRDWDWEQEQRIQKSYDKWIDDCGRLIFEATKAANWLADVVRRDINPLFFAIEGKFLVTHGPYFGLRYKTELREYTSEQKTQLPEALSQLVEKIKDERDQFLAEADM